MVSTMPPSKIGSEPSIRIDTFSSSSRTVWTMVFASPRTAMGKSCRCFAYSGNPCGVFRFLLAGDPRIDYLEARAWVDDDVLAQAAAQRAIEKGNAQGLQLIVARAYGILCQIGNGDSTAQDCDNARKRYTAVGDRDNATRTTADFAILYYEQGDLDRADAMYREAIKVFRQIGDLEGVTTASANLGDISLARGDLAVAARGLSDAIPGYKEMADQDGLALTLADLAKIARLRGDLKSALAGYKQAQATAQEIADKRAVAYALAGAGDVLEDQGDLRAARNSYQESLALCKEIGDKQAVAETELALARLSIRARPCRRYRNCDP